jgi:hypothetical protein
LIFFQNNLFIKKVNDSTELVAGGGIEWIVQSDLPVTATDAVS